MATLEIRKKTVSVWTHISTDFPQNILSKLYCKSDGDYFRYVEISGRQRARFHYSNITVYDDSQGGGAETFTSALHLMLRLEDLEYPAFDFGSSMGIGFQPTIVNPQNGQTLIYHNGQWINVYPNLDDKILQFGTITIDENEVTLGGTWIWRISGITYSNLAPFVQNVPFASAGLRRTDIFVANQSNTFTYIQGIEAENAVRPEIPDNTLLATSINVYPDGVGIGDNGLGIFNRVVDIPFSEFGDDWANVTKENVAEKINDLEITQAQNEVLYFVVDDSVTPPIDYNFDVESVDWTDTPYGDLTLIENFESWLASEMGMTSINITDFTSSETRIQCNITYDTMFDEVLFLSLGITQVHNVTFLKEDLETLSFEMNNLTEIPTISHLTSLTRFDLNFNNISDIDNLEYYPSLIELELGWNNISSLLGVSGLMNIEYLYISNNNITTAGWEDGLTWAQNVIENGIIYTANNSDSITGTDIETELLSNNWTIY